MEFLFFVYLLVVIPVAGRTEGEARPSSPTTQAIYPGNFLALPSRVGAVSPIVWRFLVLLAVAYCYPLYLWRKELSVRPYSLSTSELTLPETNTTYWSSTAHGSPSLKVSIVILSLYLE